MTVWRQAFEDSACSSETTGVASPCCLRPQHPPAPRTTHAGPASCTGPPSTWSTASCAGSRVPPPTPGAALGGLGFGGSATVSIWQDPCPSEPLTGRGWGHLSPRALPRGVPPTHRGSEEELGVLSSARPQAAGLEHKPVACPERKQTQLSLFLRDSEEGLLSVGIGNPAGREAPGTSRGGKSGPVEGYGQSHPGGGHSHHRSCRLVGRGQGELPSPLSSPISGQCSQWPNPARSQGPWNPVMPWAQSRTEQRGGGVGGKARDPSKANRQGCSHLRGPESLPAKSKLVSLTCVSWESLQQRMGRTSPSPEGLRTKLRALQPKPAL